MGTIFEKGVPSQSSTVSWKCMVLMWNIDLFCAPAKMDEEHFAANSLEHIFLECMDIYIINYVTISTASRCSSTVSVHCRVDKTWACRLGTYFRGHQRL